MARVPRWLDERFPLRAFLEDHVTGYPAPRNLNYLWSFGSLALMFLGIQIVTGLWLAMYYKPDAGLAFESVQHIMRDVNWGWLIRYLHAVGASGFFLVVYLHVGRGLYYGSYKGPRELLWWLGIAIFFALMAQAFTGYLLPWGNMSYWSATVITNLFGVVPVIGEKLVIWLRGDFAVGDATLTRFFAFHVALIPVAVIGGLVALHLTALHRVGSNNPEGVDLDKHGPNVIPFHPYFVAKDLWFAGLVLAAYLAFAFFWPTYAMEPLNWEPPNLFATPGHIVPEWYFLPFYAILRSIPSKLWGAVTMQAAILILALLPFLDRSRERSSRRRPVKRVLTVLFFLDFGVLAWAGAQPPISAGILLVERVATGYYFLYFVLLPFLPWVERTRGKAGTATSALFVAGAAALLVAGGARPAAALDLGPDAVEAGRQVFESNCHSCHAMKYLGYEAQLPADAAESAFGVVPPDLSLMAAARGRGTSGAEYVHRLLTSYTDTPEKNSVFPGIAMPVPIPQDDPKLEEKSRHVAAFLYAASFPEFRTRRRLGWYVVAYVALLTVLLFLRYRSVWHGVSHRLRPARPGADGPPTAGR